LEKSLNGQIANFIDCLNAMLMSLGTLRQHNFSRPKALKSRLSLTTPLTNPFEKSTLHGGEKVI